jgi:hypothetical protein
LAVELAPEQIGSNAAQCKRHRQPCQLLDVTKAMDNCRLRQKSVDIIFGSGRWACLGKSIVYIELNKIIFEVRL